MAITGISVTPHREDDPDADLAATARLTPTGGHGSATLTPESSKAPPHGQIGLWSASNGSNYQIQPHKIKDLKKTSIMKKCNDVWEQVKKHVEEREKNAGRMPEGATDIEIETRPNPDATNHENSRVTREIVTMSYTDGLGNKHYIDQREIPQDILVKMDKIRQLVRPHVNFGAPTPLQITVKEFLPPKDLDEFLEKDFPALEASLPEPAKSNALRNVLATESMIQGFKTHLGAIIDHKQAELDDNTKTAPLPYPDRRSKEDDLKKLKRLQQQLDNADRRAICSAVATWNNPETGPIDDQVRAKLRTTADTVTLNGERAFKERQTARESTISYKMGRAVRLIQPLDPKEARAYHLDMGDLLLPDRWDAQGRRTDTQRSDTRSCIEQLLVQMMTQLHSKEPGIPLDRHPILEGLSESTRKQLIGTIEASPLPSHEAGKPAQYYPREYARTVYKHLQEIPELGNPSLDLQRRLAAARRDPNPHTRYDSCIRQK
jgi:hypothetical protein